MQLETAFFAPLHRSLLAKEGLDAQPVVRKRRYLFLRTSIIVSSVDVSQRRAFCLNRPELELVLVPKMRQISEPERRQQPWDPLEDSLKEHIMYLELPVSSYTS